MGFCVCRPDRVWVDWGLYSGVEDTERDNVSPETAESDHFLFLLPGTGVVSRSDPSMSVFGTAWADVEFAEASAVISVESLDFLGPLLIPGLPRPRPLPELVIEPSGRT